MTLKIEEFDDITIGELFEFISKRENVKLKEQPDDIVIAPVDTILSESMNSKLEIEFKPINYIMKHRVQKEMFKVQVGTDAVEITGDHSIMILRDGVLQSEKAKNVASSDKLFSKKTGWTHNFKITSLGIEDCDVYDIEVQDNHNFFGNDILTHNSFYYQIKPIVQHKFGKDADASTPGIIDWINEFEKKFIQKVIQDSILEYAEILNVFDPSKIGVEREIISDRAFFVAKKRYAARVMDMEGVRFNLDDPYIKSMGLEIARSSTPKWVKQKLQESINVILDNNANGVRKWRDETKLLYNQQPIEDISAIQSVSNLDYDLKQKGVPQGSKSAIAHNNWVKQNGLEKEIELLIPGEKYKRCYLLTPNRFGVEIISYADPKIAKIIEEDGIFDYKTNFEKQFEQPLERMVEGMHYDIRDVPVFGDLEDW